jgi:hypothetical protein
MIALLPKLIVALINLRGRPGTAIAGRESTLQVRGGIRVRTPAAFTTGMTRQPTVSHWADLLIALAEEFHVEAAQLATIPYRAGLAREDALSEAVAGFWRTYGKRRGELIGIFRATMTKGRFQDRRPELRAEAISCITGEIQATGLSILRSEIGPVS